MTDAQKFILALLVLFLLLNGLDVFEDALKRRMGLGVSFKFLWYHRLWTIPLYFLFLAFMSRLGYFLFFL